MIQFIGDDGIFRAQESFEKSAIGVKTRAIKDGVIRAQEFAEFAFDVSVHGLRPADEPDRGKTLTPVIQRFLGSLDYRRMLSQPQVIVGAEVKHWLAIALGDPDAGGLRRGNNALTLRRARGGDFSKQGIELISKSGGRHFFQFRITLPDWPDSITSNPF